MLLHLAADPYPDVSDLAMKVLNSIAYKVCPVCLCVAMRFCMLIFFMLRQSVGRLSWMGSLEGSAQFSLDLLQKEFLMFQDDKTSYELLIR